MEMSKIKYVSIIEGNTPYNAGKFDAIYVPKIAELMEMQNIHFLFSDKSGYGINTYKYLKRRKYQNYTVYHINENSKVKSNLSKRFSSYIEINEALEQDGDEIIKYNI